MAETKDSTPIEESSVQPIGESEKKELDEKSVVETNQDIDVENVDAQDNPKTEPLVLMIAFMLQEKILEAFYAFYQINLM